MLERSNAFSGFAVPDMDAAKQFYGDVLGLEVSVEAAGIGLHLAGGTTVFVYPKADHTPATYTILNFPVPDIDRAVAELSAAGVQFEQYTGELQTDEDGVLRGGDGPLIAWFKDPAGNILSVLESES